MIGLHATSFPTTLRNSFAVCCLAIATCVTAVDAHPIEIAQNQARPPKANPTPASPAPANTPRVQPTKQQYAVKLPPRFSDIQEQLSSDLKNAANAPYCDGTASIVQNVLTLYCTPRPDGKVPLKFGSLGWIDVTRNDTLSEDRFEIAAIREPYPLNWLFKEPSGYILARSNSLSLALKLPVELSQGAPGCTLQHQPTLKDFYFGRILNLPDPPCRSYKVVVVNSPAGLSIKIRKGCSVSADVSVPIEAGEATCLSKISTTAVPPTLVIELATGFDAVSVQVPGADVANGQFALDVSQQLGQLSVPWPFAPARTPMDQFSNELPTYEPVSVKLLSANGQQCGSTHFVVNEPSGLPRLPKLGEQGCNSVPTKAEFQFRKTAAASKVPGGAFVDDHTVPITFGEAPPLIRVEALKKELDIKFSISAGQDYDNRLGRGVRNTFLGPHLFGNGCGARVDSIGPIPFVADGAAPTKKAKWPLYAVVFDSNSEAVTRCAISKVAADENGRPFLTFEFEEARASGPRRLVVIAAGQQVVGANSALRRALENALLGMVDALDTAKKKGARLSPINVLFVRADGVFEEVIKGEDAAFDPAAAKQAIANRFTAVAPDTPDFPLLEKMPQAKDFDRIVVVMDGSTTDRNGIRTLADWAGPQFKRHVMLLITSSTCAQWLSTDCQRIGAGPSDLQAVTRPIAEKLNLLIEQPVTPARPSPPPRQ